MIIQSSFVDFYDYVAKSNIDRNIVYRRFPSDEIIDPVLSQNVKSHHHNYSKRMKHLHPGYDLSGRDLRPYYIGLGGEIYPLRVVWDRDHLKELVYWGNTPASKWEEFYSQKLKDFAETYRYTHREYLFDTYGPVFSVEFSARREGLQAKVVKNCCMKDFGINQMVDANTAYSNLYKFMCNHGLERPVPEMTNDVKIEQHGFDLKTSFRKRKESDV